eukprot:TRINITY_DN10970_c0_g1_i1.p1 TRINITY_DN10970_c0_g1~~TRINITY_DN10970_c0_g1_i1.p1  ORF type:complete len:382 (+),score=-14.31 TRINITY_DN10970_c0_g1_i1:135-1148(+)
MILAVSYDSEGNMNSTERFLPNMPFSHPIDMAFGPNGDLYVLEYGTGWFLKNDDSRLVKIEFNAGNRKPSVQVSANQKAGAVPMAVKLSSEGTKDFDGDAMTYQWKIYNKAGGQPTTLSEPNPTFTFQKPGQYKAILTVTDAHGLKDSREVDIMAGNQPPTVALEITKGNKSFYFPGEPIAYKVSVSDKEDGSLAASGATPGRILAKQVMVKASYQDEASAQNASEAGHKFSEATYLGAGQVLMEKSDCKACHFTDKKSVGPAFVEVAKTLQKRRQRGSQPVEQDYQRWRWGLGRCNYDGSPTTGPVGCERDCEVYSHLIGQEGSKPIAAYAGHVYA